VQPSPTFGNADANLAIKDEKPRKTKQKIIHT
jgi:hypothetical protein